MTRPPAARRRRSRAPASRPPGRRCRCRCRSRSTADERDVAVEQAERHEGDDQQADDRQGRRQPAAGRAAACRPRAAARGATVGSRRAPGQRRRDRRCGKDRPPSADGCPDVATSRMSSWSDSKPPNVRLVRRATTSRRSPSWTVSAMSDRPNAIPSSTSSSRRRVSWLWPPVAARTRVTVSPRTATSGSGFPGPHGARPASSRKRP